MLEHSRQNKEMQTLDSAAEIGAKGARSPERSHNKEAVAGAGSAPSTAAKNAASEQKQTRSLPVPKKNGPPKPVLILLLVALIFGGYKAWLYFQPKNMDQLRVSGRIEGYETNVGAKIPGRVDFIAVREGAVVHKGELIVKLSDDDIQAQRRGAQARLKKAIEQRDQAVQQIDVIQAQINEAELNKQMAVENAGGHIAEAEANVATATANLAQAESQLAQAIADMKLAELRKGRYGKLARQGAVSQDESDRPTPMNPRRAQSWRRANQQSNQPASNW